MRTIARIENALNDMQNQVVELIPSASCIMEAWLCALFPY